jgi:nitrogen fixation NifU-like protein
MENYSEKVMDHFRNPRNVGEIENPDGVGRVGNPVCGDIMELYIKVHNNIITDEAEKISNKAVAEALGGLPPIKMHCSVLAEEALKKALEDYRSRN